MWLQVKMVLKDPRMICVWIFTVFLVVIFSVVSARPWNNNTDNDFIEKRDVTEEKFDCEKFGPNVVIVRHSAVEDFNAEDDKCLEENKKKQRKERKKKRTERRRKRRQRKMMRKRKRKQKKLKMKKPKTKTGEKEILTKQQKRRRRLRRQRKLFLEQEEFRRWKRKLSMANLLQEPVAQDAITDLWTDLLGKGPQWREIYKDMHRYGEEEGHNTTHHNIGLSHNNTEKTKTTLTTSPSPLN